MRRRHFNIAIVFVWALAHGVWIGAGMHSLSDVGSRLNTAKGRVSACAGCRSAVDSREAQSLSSSAGCSICQLSTVLPETASVSLPVIYFAPVVFAAPQPFAGIAPSFDACALPPTHAPPV